MEAGNETKNNDKKKAIAISIGSHLILLILFFIVAAWTEPDPPIPEYGIELAFIGQSSEAEQVEKSQDAIAEKSLVEEIKQQKVPVEESEPIEDTQTEVVESIEATEPIVTEDVNSPDVNTKPVEEQEVAQEKIEDKPEINPIKENAIEEIPKEVPVVVSEPEPEVDDRAIFQKSGDDGTESIDSGSAGGSSLNMSGWMWDSKPMPDDTSIENGKIVFRINVDGEGEITRIETIESTVSPAVKKVYENSVMELTFSKTSGNKSVASTSTGIITFIIRSK